MISILSKYLFYSNRLQNSRFLPGNTDAIVEYFIHLRFDALLAFDLVIFFGTLTVDVFGKDLKNKFKNIFILKIFYKICDINFTQK